MSSTLLTASTVTRAILKETWGISQLHRLDVDDDFDPIIKHVVSKVPFSFTFKKMDLKAQTADLRQEIAKINRVLTDGTALTQ